MREILFRGKDFSGVLNRSWIFGSLDTTENENIIMIYPDRFGNKCQIFIDPKTVGQYTGLTDKNGKKIFEGDVLRVKGHDYDYNLDFDYTTTVFLVYHELCVAVRSNIFDFLPIDFAYKTWHEMGCDIEVIGNIHDNPELKE